MLVLISLFISTLQWDNFRFSRDRQCINLDDKGHCKDWSENTILYRSSSSLYYCFPGDAYVLTRDGPKQMLNLKLGDELFGINLETAKNQFSQLTAWLHRDTQSLMEFSLISVQNSQWKFLSSDYHNIAYSTDNKIDFKFLKDLNANDTLISLTNSGEDFRVSNTNQKVQKQGLYSPLTKLSTFYIFPDSFTIDQYESKTQDYPMILVHCLSQVINPTQSQHFVSSFVRLSHVVFGTHEPQEDEEYVNPLLSTFHGLFGNDWVNVGGEKIAHKYSSTYSNAQQREREERKKKTMAIIALETVLSDTLL